MKKLFFLCALAASVMTIASCSKNETYSDQLDRETATVLTRFSEYNILKEAVQLTNKSLYWSNIVDKMSVTNTRGTYTASFNSESSIMANAYKSTSVPSGWLVSIPYVNIGRLIDAKSKLAHVKLIVPSQQGQVSASRGVYPCMYDITFQRGL